MPTIVIGAFYASLNQIDALSLLLDKFKAGYWFTIALFEYYLIFDCVRFVSFRRQKMFDALLIVVACACYIIAMPSVLRFYQNSPILQILGVSQWKYFIFFVLGVFVKRFSIVVQSEYFGYGVFLICLLIYGGNEILHLELSGFLFNANLLLKEIFIVLLVYVVFARSQSRFSVQTRLGKTLVCLGTNTLEIYLLHYFVLPRHLDKLFDVEGLIANPMIGLYADVLLSFMVIAIVFVVIYLFKSNRLLFRN